MLFNLQVAIVHVLIGALQFQQTFQLGYGVRAIVNPQVNQFIVPCFLYRGTRYYNDGSRLPAPYIAACRLRCFKACNYPFGQRKIGAF
jgi:hypothetical protein